MNSFIKENEVGLEVGSGAGFAKHFINNWLLIISTGWSLQIASRNETLWTTEDSSIEAVQFAKQFNELYDTFADSFGPVLRRVEETCRLFGISTLIHAQKNHWNNIANDEGSEDEDLDLTGGVSDEDEKKRRDMWTGILIDTYRNLEELAEQHNVHTSAFAQDQNLVVKIAGDLARSALKTKLLMMSKKQFWKPEFKIILFFYFYAVKLISFINVHFVDFV